MIVFPIKYNTNLGNWMFQYATALSLGGRVGVWFEDKSKVAQFESYRELFPDVEKVDDLVGLKRYLQSDFRYAQIPKFDDDVFLDGFFQSAKFFDEAVVRKRFAISYGQRVYLREKYGDWLQRANVTGISVRKGADYREQCHMHPFVGERYFRTCITLLPDCNDFIVCSDNLSWCKVWFSKEFPSKRFLFVENESVLDQLYVQTLCKNNVLSNSSFSWWGGWLNDNPDKRVFAPSKWFGPLALLRGIDWRDIYFEGVEIVDSSSTFAENVRAWSKALWLFAKIKYVSSRRMILGR